MYEESGNLKPKPLKFDRTSHRFRLLNRIWLILSSKPGILSKKWI